MVQDTRPVRAQIRAILDRCNPDELRDIYEYLKKVKPLRSASGTETRIMSTMVDDEREIHVDIDYLCGKWMHRVGVVAEWIFDKYFKDSGTRPFERVLQETKICYAGILPVRLVAILDSEPIGTISVIKYHEGEMNFTPFITYLYVLPEYKGKGVEQKLVAYVLKTLKSLGHREAYLKNDIKPNLSTEISAESVQGIPDIHRIAI